MIVIIVDKQTQDEEFVEDASCVVIDQFNARICWDGHREDRWVETGLFLVSVVP